MKNIERNKEIWSRYKEMWNIETYHKTKVGYVYMQLGREYGLAAETVREIVYRMRFVK